MKKLLLSACVAAACWVSNTEGMRCKTEDGQSTSIVRYESRNDRFLMITRWELGNSNRIAERCEYLHIDYSGTEKRFEGEKSKANLTAEMRQAMKNALETLPDSVGELTHLRVLDVYGDGYGIRLKVLPDFIGKLVNLRTLNLSHNELGYIPDSIGNLENLETLDVSNNKLETIPDSIGNLKNLETLKVNSNNLETLPDSIGNLKNLEELYLSINRCFSKLPNSIGNLRKLEVLDLHITKLNSLPESFENLTNLKILSLSEANQERNGCYYESSYSSAWYLNVINQSLKHWSCPAIDYSDNDTIALDLSGKNLKQIPFGVYMMNRSRGLSNRYIPALKELDVSNNQITEIPRLLERLWLLEKLYIHNNPNLNHLPDFLWKMPNLKELKIDGKLIKDLPGSAEYSLDNEDLENAVLGLILDGKNNKKMSDEELAKRTGPYIVHLRK